MATNVVTSQAQTQTPPLEFRHDMTPMVKNILLCTDFSAVSAIATKVAMDLCKQTGAALRVLHVCEYGSQASLAGSEATYLAEEMQREEKCLSEVVNRVRTEGIAVDVSTEVGHPPVAIVEFIASHCPDLAIVGTSGISGLERMMFGSTAEAVFRRAICPVIIVGPRVSATRYRQGPVVFATDFHEPAKQAAQYACALASVNVSQLHCLHVLPLSVENEGKDGIHASIMKEALHQVAGDPHFCEAQRVYNVVYDSEVSHAVVDYAKEHGASFLVLGVRRGPMLSSHLPPHLTYRMIATAPCPVLTVSMEAARRAAKADSSAKAVS